MGRTAAQVMGARGDEVVTVAPAQTLEEVAAILAGRGIGAVVVIDDEQRVAGMLSERDLVRQLSEHGPSCLEDTVDHVMSRDITTRTEAASTDEMLGLMTDGRFRHIPIVDDERLVGIVSIGDVVKAQIDELRGERDQLQEYVAGGY